MTILGVIPARAGSIGLPEKHLRLLGGRPLVQHTIEAAWGSRRLDRVILSTNDPRIARAARAVGVEVPFQRPDELAGERAPTVAVIQHAVAWAEEAGSTVDIVVTLQPTSPLRTSAQIDDAIALLDEPDVRSAVTVATLGEPISVVGSLRDGRFLRCASGAGDQRRQAAAPAVRLTGGVYVTRRDLLAEGMLIDAAPAALLVEDETAIDIDTIEDLRRARRARRSQRARGSS
jgi:CMP-N,N'-diacetyllegionaminic acid synthase